MLNRYFLFTLSEQNTEQQSDEINQFRNEFSQQPCLLHKKTAVLQNPKVKLDMHTCIHTHTCPVCIQMEPPA